MDLLDKVFYTLLSQAVDFFNNLVPSQSSGFENGTIIGDYWYYGYSNKTIFGDYWPNFSIRTMGDYWENMFGAANMTNSNYTSY